MASGLILLLIALYRTVLAPWLGGHCRYEPSCSEYAAQAVRQHGAVDGSILSVKRVIRCHPWGGAGFDPVPPASCAPARGPE